MQQRIDWTCAITWLAMAIGVVAFWAVVGRAVLA